MNLKLPNILWIFSDQHRAQAMGCSGDENIWTPNMDRLANEGIRFENAYSNSPICSPFRAVLYTGTYMTTNGVVSNHIPIKSEQRMLAQELHDLGYHTSHMGKWHLAGGAAPTHFVSPYFRPGWDEWLGWENSNKFWDTTFSTGMLPMPVKKLDGYQTDCITDYTVDWIKNRITGSPWFHVVSVEPPHPPYTAPEEYMKIFRDKTLKLRDNVPETIVSEEFLKNIKGYYAQIANLDYNIGRIVNALEETDQLDDTIIFYFSDHGDLMGSHGMMEKCRPEVESSKIPLIIRYPKRIPKGTVSDALISGVDIAPTLLGLVGAKVPGYMEGKDLSGIVCGMRKEGAELVLLQFENTFFEKQPEKAFRAIVHDGWMYVYYLMTGPFQLFNLEDDPFQKQNLVALHEYNVVRNKLHALLKKKLYEINDNFFARSREYQV